MNDIFQINDLRDLEKYLETNFLKIQDYFNQNYDTLRVEINDWRRYVLLNSAFAQLAASNSINNAFLVILFNYFERLFPDGTCCKNIYNKLKEANVIISNRLEAASLFIFVPDNTYFISRYEDIIMKLQIAYCNEEDIKEIVVISFANYFIKVLVDPPPSNNTFISQFKDKTIQCKATNNYYFLNHPLIEELINLDIADVDIAHKNIQYKIDKLLRDIYQTEKVDTRKRYLIEEDTVYANELTKVNPDFKNIRNISSSFSYKIIDKDSVHFSLGRGVSIIKDEEQLFYYIHSYGSMHEAKLSSAFNYMDENFINNKIELIDWGCGQGIASIVFAEKFYNLSNNINRFLLIEPSEICIKRATLHIKKFIKDAEIITVNKDIDSLNENDFLIDGNKLKIHLFSNILDIEYFNISNLIQLITKTQKGDNLFICVSPFIDIAKTQRIDSFVSYFQSNYPTSFEKIAEETVSKNDSYWNCSQNYNNGCKCFNHTGNGCYNKKWTKIIRIFKVIIS